MDPIALLNTDLRIAADLVLVGSGAIAGLCAGLAWYHREREIGRLTRRALRMRRRWWQLA